jgi:hypothetical protein
MGRACTTNGQEENAYRILVGKSEGKTPIGRQNVGGWVILKWILDS